MRTNQTKTEENKNMTDFFKDCSNLTDGAKLYKELMKKHHPDMGGDTATAQAINDQFDNFTLRTFKTFKETEFRYDGKPYNFDEIFFSEVVMKIINLPIDIEQVGFWLYARNYDSKTQSVLNSFGFWKSGKHDCMIFNGELGGIRKKRTNLSMNQIRYRHGSMVIEKEEKKLKKIA